MKEKLLAFEKEKWFYNQVKSGGSWDYKKEGHPEMEHVENFNYGATGSALGLSEYTLKIAAGGYQIISGTYISKMLNSKNFVKFYFLFSFSCYDIKSNDPWNYFWFFIGL